MAATPSLRRIELAASAVPHLPPVAQDAYDELLWAVLRGADEEAVALQDALAALLRELRRASPGAARAAA